MAVKIKLARGGAKKSPFYRIVVMDSRRRRDSAYLDQIGYYDPMKDPAEIKIYSEEKVLQHLREGAKYSNTVKSIFSKHGIMKKYHIDIVDISIDKNEWIFSLEEDLDGLYLANSNAIYISSPPQKFMSINGEFWFYLADSDALLAFISSIYPDFWYPNVVCYDKNLKIKKIYKSQKPIREIKLFLPKGTKYIKVTDSLMPQNLKHGIKIFLEGKR